MWWNCINIFTTTVVGQSYKTYWYNSIEQKECFFLTTDESESKLLKASILTDLWKKNKAGKRNINNHFWNNAPFGKKVEHRICQTGFMTQAQRRPTSRHGIGGHGPRTTAAAVLSSFIPTVCCFRSKSLISKTQCTATVCKVLNRQREVSRSLFTFEWQTFRCTTHTAFMVGGSSCLIQF